MVRAAAPVITHRTRDTVVLVLVSVFLASLLLAWTMQVAWSVAAPVGSPPRAGRAGPWVLPAVPAAVHDLAEPAGIRKRQVDRRR